MSRTIIFGDIHGCLDEWRDLIRAADVQPEDRLISVGDIINRGPDTTGCLELAMQLPNFTYILGNHELRFLNAWKQGRIPSGKPYDMQTVWQMSDGFDRYMKYISRQSLYLDMVEALVIHAGLRPGISLEKQSVEDLTEIRLLSAQGLPWYEAYHDSKLIVFGHWVRREPLIRPNAVGLDTGCVYGGKLSALILPSREVISVPAKKAYSIRSKPWA
jgi:hypothetical protein